MTLTVKILLELIGIMNEPVAFLPVPKSVSPGSGMPVGIIFIGIVANAGPDTPGMPGRSVLIFTAESGVADMYKGKELVDVTVKVNSHIAEMLPTP